jgi:urease accessory protein
MNQSNRISPWVLGGLLLASATATWAHAEHGAATGFLAGMAHPVSGFDHVLAMVAVGLWGAQLGNPALWALPVVFPLIMACGGLLGLLGLPLPGVEFGIALSGVVLGFAVATRKRPPLWLAIALVAIFAIFHGHAHGTELPEGADGLRYSLGFVIATGALHACGIAIGMVQKLPHGAQVLRGLGAIVGIGGLYFLIKAFG